LNLPMVLLCDGTAARMATNLKAATIATPVVVELFFTLHSLIISIRHFLSVFKFQLIRLAMRTLPECLSTTSVATTTAMPATRRGSATTPTPELWIFLVFYFITKMETSPKSALYFVTIKELKPSFTTHLETAGKITCQRIADPATLNIRAR
jgi:hypothetical protein